ncbi:MAG: FHA domain-containing protein [Planctomycetes bacterium]|nr:FHA domain-containing protein [Planctomycetota bacterium]
MKVNPEARTKEEPRQARAGACLVHYRASHTVLHILERQNFFIGRSPRCNMVLSSGKVSRQHAIIRNQGGSYEIFDCASTNGVVVNGERIRTRVLSDGDRIVVGPREIEFRILGAQEVKP